MDTSKRKNLRDKLELALLLLEIAEDDEAVRQIIEFAQTLKIDKKGYEDFQSNRETTR